MGYQYQRSDEGLATPPWLGDFSGQRQGWKSQGEPGVSKSVECDTFPFDTVGWTTGRAFSL